MTQIRSLDIVKWIFTALLLGGTFCILDMQSVPLGDDLGYMFTDSVHHLGDGHRVGSTEDITRTMSAHYLTTNGRFIVHWIAMFFLNIAGHVWFCIVNSIVFLMTALFFSRLGVYSKKVSFGTIVSLTILMWISVPFPGTTWLGLVCYATNYLWTACATLIFLWYFEQEQSNFCQDTKGIKLLGKGVLCLIAGSLQESFSMPVSAGLLIIWILRYNRFSFNSIVMTVTYWIGTAVCFFAPGNIHHAEQGGGLEIGAVMRKSVSLLHALFNECPVFILALALLFITLVIARKDTYSFIKNNILIVCIVLTSLLLASVSFTSARQLTCPMLLIGILCFRLAMRLCGRERLSKWISGFGSWLGVGLYLVAFYASYILREETGQRMESLYEQVETGARVLIYYPEKMERQKGMMRIFKRYDFAQLPVVFDTYTKHGISRLYASDGSSDRIQTILPAPVETILESARKSNVGRGSILTAPLIPKYRCFMIPRDSTISRLRDRSGHIVRYERVTCTQGILIVVPDTPDTYQLYYK